MGSVILDDMAVSCLHCNFAGPSRGPMWFPFPEVLHVLLFEKKNMSKVTIAEAPPKSKLNPINQESALHSI